MDKGPPLDCAPAQGGHHLVDESPLAVGPEPLEPDDAPQGWRQSEKKDVSENQRDDLARMIFDEDAEEIVLASLIEVRRRIGRRRVRDAVWLVLRHFGISGFRRLHQCSGVF